MAEQGECPVCKSASQRTYDGRVIVLCTRCGEYVIGRITINELANFSNSQISNLSGWIRENQNYFIAQSDLDRFSKLKTPSVGEKANKLLFWLSSKFPKSGAGISLLLPSAPVIKQGRLSTSFNPDSIRHFVNPEFLARSWSEDFEELCYLVDEYLEKEMKLLEVLLLPGLNAANYRITPKGWAYIESSRQGNPSSKTGFIAMWFDESVNDMWMALDKGIAAAGYIPFRIDQKQHNNKIDDEIVAGIRRSKFLVADFTGHRGGVYFEAGLAMGLGLPVIWLCRKDELEKTHFDTRQYNFIVWEADKLEELSNAMKNRIVATIGQGPLQFSHTT